VVDKPRYFVGVDLAATNGDESCIVLCHMDDDGVLVIDHVEYPYHRPSVVSVMAEVVPEDAVRKEEGL